MLWPSAYTLNAVTHTLIRCGHLIDGRKASAPPASAHFSIINAKRPLESVILCVVGGAALAHTLLAGAQMTLETLHHNCSHPLSLTTYTYDS